MKLISLFAMAATLVSTHPVAAAVPAPQLMVVISVDQFSSDLFNEYRRAFTGGFKRLEQGVVFPSAYHSHAVTETCPGHAVILTGDRPARTGIIGNNWTSFAAPRGDKQVYCAEDETVAGTSSKDYRVSPVHLRVPTLGDRMKADRQGGRVVSVAGKDRAAVMLAGHKADRTIWWHKGAYRSYEGVAVPPAIAAINQTTGRSIAAGLPAPALPTICEARARPVAIGQGRTVGSAPTALAPGATTGFLARSEFDQATLDAALALVDGDNLGKRSATDLLAISLSATDYVGHGFGTEGPEMCNQIMALDGLLEKFFEQLDARGIRYAVALTADHGGHDLPERNRERGIPDDSRTTEDFSIATLNEVIAPGAPPVIRGDSLVGDLYIDPSVSAAARGDVIRDATAWLRDRPEIAAVFTADELRAVPPATLPPEAWSLAERAAASFDTARSGDLLVLLKPRLVPIPDPTKGYVATHGSAWDYDRRVPALFWWSGITGFEQPNSIETVDIMPSIARLVGVDLKPGDVDGQCRDLDAGPDNSCVSPPTRR